MARTVLNAHTRSQYFLLLPLPYTCHFRPFCHRVIAVTSTHNTHTRNTHTQQQQHTNTQPNKNTHTAPWVTKVMLHAAPAANMLRFIRIFDCRPTVQAYTTHITYKRPTCPESCNDKAFFPRPRGPARPTFSRCVPASGG